MPEELRARFRATVHYDGTAFHGWQSQPDRRTVQDALEASLSRLQDAPVRITAAGRTDAGVHATGQEISFRARPKWTADDLHRAVNAVSPDDVWVEKVRPAPGEFHPRYDATGRRYEYRVGIREDAASPLRRHRIWALCRPVDEELLAAATALLPGERSFEGFAKAGQPERGTRCRVEDASWSPTAAGDLGFVIVADRFLHHMVRYLVSTLLDVATGRRRLGELEALLATRDEARPPTPAPPWGLYLTGVRYEDGWNRPPGIPGLPASPSGVGRSEAATGATEAATGATEAATGATGAAGATGMTEAATGATPATETRPQGPGARSAERNRDTTVPPDGEEP